MTRNLLDLESNAYKFWPEKIAELERNSSVIPTLIQTQDKFISLLNFANSDPFAWQDVLTKSKELTANLFVKHLMVLSDVAGEKLMRFKGEIDTIFKDGEMEFAWNEKKYKYILSVFITKNILHIYIVLIINYL